MKKFLFMFLFFSVLASGLMADEHLDFIKGRKLFETGKYREALEKVNEGIEKYGESVRWLTGKFYILKALGKSEQALEVGIRREGMATRKVPFKSLELAHLCLQLNKKEQALDWIEEAVNRGFRRYPALLTEARYKTFQEEPRFIALIEKIKTNIGIGKPAKDIEIFTTVAENDDNSGNKTGAKSDGKGDGESAAGDQGKKEKKVLLFNLAGERGKVVLVNFFAAWNANCVKEIPDLKRLYDKYKGKGFEIIGISLDNEAGPVAALEKRENLKWRNFFTGKGFEDDACVLYGVRSIPSGWLIDKKGILRHFGLSGPALEKAVAGLLAE
jgi:thiol-disulfide isomerase/thioredoxin